MKKPLVVSILCSIILASCQAKVQNTANEFNQAVDSVTDTAGTATQTVKDTIELGKQKFGQTTETIDGLVEKADQIGEGISNITNGVKEVKKGLAGAQNSSN